MEACMKVWITDRWWGADPATNKKTIKKSRFGIGSRWQVSHYAPGLNSTKSIVSKDFDRLADAEAFRTKTEHEMRAGIYIQPEIVALTFLDAAAAWLAGKKKPSGASLHRYTNALDIWVLPTWAGRTLSTIRRTEIDAWLSKLISGTAAHATGRRVSSAGLSPSSLAAVWVPFNASLANSVTLGWIRTNPARGVELPKSRSPEKIFLNYLEVERLTRAAKERSGQLSDSMMIELMAYAGLRPGEAVALQVGDVDIASRRIKVRRTVTIDINGKAIFGEPKHGERREVPIAPHLISDLRTLSEGKESPLPLLETTRGHYINIHNWRSRVWKPALAAAGMADRGLTPKALRHSAASMAIAAGADVKVVQRMLGHSDASMTLNTYADLWPDRLDEVTNAMSIQREKALAQPQP
jgi:integrase